MMPGRCIAESSTAWYPARVLIELSTSIDCARAIRGTRSSEKVVSPASARRPTRSCSISGSSVDTRNAPRGRWTSISGSGARTPSTISAPAYKVAGSDSILAPASTNSSSLIPDAVPADDSTCTASPPRTIRLTVRGVAATRVSPSARSRGTTTFIRTTSLLTAYRDSVSTSCSATCLPSPKSM